MKNKKLKITTILASALAATAMIAPVLTACHKGGDQPQPVSEFFEIVNDELKGFRSDLTEEQKKEACKGGVLTLPAVSTIAESAFDADLHKDAPFAEEIVIDAKTTLIKARAFFGNTAKKITWNGGVAASNVNHIGESAFAFCPNLESFEFPAGLLKTSTKNQPSIEKEAFFSCDKLGTLDLTCASSESFEVPQFAPGAFRGLEIKNGKVIFNQPQNDFQYLMYGNLWSRLVLGGIDPHWEEYSKNAEGEAVKWDNQVTVAPEEYLIKSGGIGGTITGINTAAWTDDTFNTIVVTEAGSGVVIGLDENFKLMNDALKDKQLKYVFFSNTLIKNIPAGFEQNDQARPSLKIYWPGTVETIGDNAFNGCKATNIFAGLTNLVNVGAGAFRNCNTITEFAIAHKDIKIGNDAFNGATKLELLDLSVYEGDTPGTGWGNNIFTGAGSDTGKINIIKIGATSPNPLDTWRLRNKFHDLLKSKGLDIDVHGVKNQWKFDPAGYFTDVTQLLDIDEYGVLHGWIKDSKGKQMTKSEVTLALTELGFKGTLALKNVYGVADNAFFDGTNSTLPEAIEIINFHNAIGIGKNAFKGAAGLKNIAIYKSGKIIGESAFENCSQLNTIRIGELNYEGVNNLTVGANAFKGCAKTGEIRNWQYKNKFDQWQTNYLIKTKKFSDLNWKRDDNPWTFKNKSDGVMLVNIDKDKMVDGLVKASETPDVTDESLINLSKDIYPVDNKVIFRLPKDIKGVAASAFVDGKKSLIPAEFTHFDFEADCTCESIGEYAFFYSGDHSEESTKTITLDFANATKLTTIGAHAYGLSRIGNTLTLPKTIISIGEGAFYENRIVTLVIPKNDAATTTNKVKFGKGCFAGNTTMAHIDMHEYKYSDLKDLLDFHETVFDSVAATGEFIIPQDQGGSAEFYLTWLKQHSYNIKVSGGWTAKPHA